MYDAVNDFRTAIRSTGLEPPDTIQPGKLHRFPGYGKRPGNRAGWCLLFGDAQAGCFGDWASGLSETWKAPRDQPYSKAERAALSRQVEQAQKYADAERRSRQADAATRAAAIWNSAVPAPADHPYLIRKQIGPSGARMARLGSLVVPIFSAGSITSLQFIRPNGSKRFLKNGKIAGGYFVIGENTERLLLAEGLATGATLHEKTGHAACCAFFAANLLAAGQALRISHPNAEIVVCADNDNSTDGNPGLTYGRKAAANLGAELIYPDFDGLGSGTDFNDYVLAGGVLCL